MSSSAKRTDFFKVPGIVEEEGGEAMLLWLLFKMGVECKVEKASVLNRSLGVVRSLDWVAYPKMVK